MEEEKEKQFDYKALSAKMPRGSIDSKSLIKVG